MEVQKEVDSSHEDGIKGCGGMQGVEDVDSVFIVSEDNNTLSYKV